MSKRLHCFHSNIISLVKIGLPFFKFHAGHLIVVIQHYKKHKRHINNKTIMQ